MILTLFCSPQYFAVFLSILVLDGRDAVIRYCSSIVTVRPAKSGTTTDSAVRSDQGHTKGPGLEVDDSAADDELM